MVYFIAECFFSFSTKSKTKIKQQNKLHGYKNGAKSLLPDLTNAKIKDKETVCVISSCF